MNDQHKDPGRKINGLNMFFENMIFGGRWLLMPMYVGLLLVIGVYAWVFLKQLYELLHEIVHINRAELIVSVLEMIDTVMIGNLIVMIMIGSYHIFVRNFKIDEKPQWLEHITSSTLKIKMGMSLVGISSIHLLKDFIDDKTIDHELLFKRCGIHIIFLLSMIVLAFTDKISHSKSASNEKH